MQGSRRPSTCTPALSTTVISLAMRQEIKSHSSKRAGTDGRHNIAKGKGNRPDNCLKLRVRKQKIENAMKNLIHENTSQQMNSDTRINSFSTLLMQCIITE